MDATQQTLTEQLRDGVQPYLCLFDIEKAFNSVELPIMLQNPSPMKVLKIFHCEIGQSFVSQSTTPKLLSSTDE